MAFVCYLLKVILCSGILYLYYALALKDRLFHQWNRFYLLSAIALSVLFPLLQFVITSAAEEKGKAIQLIQVVQSADDYLEAFTVSARSQISVEQWILIAYGLFGLTILSGLMLSLYKIYKMATKWGVEKIEQIKFVNTAEAGTPFTFWNYIFWNRDIPLESKTGQQIFSHELVHVKEKHTLDKLFSQIVLIPFWCNPFFWLMKKELRFVHEFIADQKSVDTNDTAAFAAMILQAAYPHHYSSIANPFFHTSIKRRLAMLTKNESPKLAYVGRLVALPLIALVAFAFTVRTKTVEKTVTLNKEFVVVIDAGHGYENGNPTGAQVDALNESDIVLSLANKIKEVNHNTNLKLVFTRPDKNFVGLKERVVLAREASADLFLSLHVGAAENTTDKGVHIYLPVTEKGTTMQNNVLGSAIIASLRSVYTTAPQPLQRKNAIYVLDQSNCPAALIEFGYLTNKDDRNFLQSDKNREAFAKGLLLAIENYAANSTTSYNASNAQDTVPKGKREIGSMDVNTSKKTITLQYTDGTSESLTMEEARKRGYLDNKDAANKKETVSPSKTANKPKPLYIVDGKEMKEEEVFKIDPKKIESINVFKDGPAIEKFGNKGKNGVVEIKRKNEVSNDKITISENNKPIARGEINKLEQNGNAVNVDAKFETINNDNAASGQSEPVFQQTEKPASIDKDEWRAFLQKHLQPIIENAASKGMKAGTYTVNVRFLVKKDGTVSDFTALDHPGYDLDKQVLAMMPNSPKWKPAEQNGKAVTSYHTQPITFVLQQQ